MFNEYIHVYGPASTFVLQQVYTQPVQVEVLISADGTNWFSKHIFNSNAHFCQSLHSYGSVYWKVVATDTPIQESSYCN